MSGPHLQLSDDLGFEPPGPGLDLTPDTLRLWISDQQWVSLLERIAREQSDIDGPRRRTEPRHPYHVTCILRLGYPGQTPGTYLVRCRNLSTGGMGFVHSAMLEPGTRCALALQGNGGAGCIVAARIAWCRPIEQVYDVGVQFDEPIEVCRYLDSVEPDEPRPA